MINQNKTHGVQHEKPTAAEIQDMVNNHYNGDLIDFSWRLLRTFAAPQSPVAPAEFPGPANAGMREWMEGPVAPADEGMLAVYVREHGSDAGWLGEQGSYFISGWQARARLADAPKGQLQCPRCAGNGTILRLSDNSPDAHDVDAECPACAGEGVVDAPAKCDGNHAGPRCADPECWNDTPVAPADERAAIAESIVAGVKAYYGDARSNDDESDAEKIVDVVAAISVRLAETPKQTMGDGKIWYPEDFVTTLTQEIEELKAELFKQADAPTVSAAVPHGWRVVPEKHTIDMTIAFAEVWFSKIRAIDDDDMQDAYSAMIEAAPTPPVSEASAGTTETKYVQRQDGEAFEVKSGELTRMACCDCGLVHDYALVSKDGEPIEAAFERNDEETARRRATLPTLAAQCNAMYIRSTPEDEERLREAMAGIQSVAGSIYKAPPDIDAALQQFIAAAEDVLRAFEGCKVRDRGFVYSDGKHTPTVLVEFPVDDWGARDKFAAAIEASKGTA